jgi:hypothetical protein
MYAARFRRPVALPAAVIRYPENRFGTNQTPNTQTPKNLKT